MSETGARGVAGAQAIGRAVQLLRLIAAGGPAGVPLADLARAAGLARPTAHRMLKALVAERMVQQEAAGRSFRLGPLAFELGLAAPQRGALIRACRPALQRLAEASQDTVYLILRSGCEAVCLDRIEASFSIRTATLGVGEWRPLGVGAAGVALLAALAPAERAACLARNAEAYGRHGGLTVAEVEQAVADAQRTGIGLSIERLTPGVSAVGIAVPGGRIGLSIASTTDRVTGDRLQALTAQLSAEAKALADVHIVDL
jgi:DNA-binding IclR family transcriptional regulator